MIEFFKSIYLLIKLKNKIFKNTILKTENWYKILAVVLFAFLFLNTIQTSAFAVQYVKAYFNKDAVLFRPLFSLTLFIIFIANIFTTFFLSGSNYSQNLFKTLLRYPVRFDRIIFYEIISGMGDFINLLFFPLYVAVIFMLNDILGWTNFLTLIVILILFLFSVSGIIYLLKNLFILSSITKHSRKLLILFSLLFAMIFIVIIERIPLFLQDVNNVILADKILELFPTWVFSHFILNIRLNFVNNNIFSTLTYFFILNIILFTLNYYIAKFLRNKNYGKSFFKISLKKSLLTRLFLRVPINPFSKKDLVYTLRSLRTMPVHLMIGVFLPILIITSANNTLDKGQSFNNIIDQFSFSILFISLLVLNFAGNIFAFEGKAIINYFFRPISYGNIIKSKTFIPNLYGAIILLTNLILLLILHTEFSNIIFYELILFLSYLLLLLLAFPLSIYFPKEVNFNAMNGFITSLVNLFMFLIPTFILLFVFQTVLTFYLHSNYKLFLSLILCAIIAIFLYYREKIFVKIGSLLLNRKEKIIMVFR